MNKDMRKDIELAFSEHRSALEKVEHSLVSVIEQAASLMVAAVSEGHTIFWCGNGGSAADSQHMAGELVGRLNIERAPIASIALTTDSSVLTCIGNDYGYDEIFRRQVKGLVREGDVLVAISTSGRSQNILNAARAARSQGARVIAMVGRDGGDLVQHADVNILVEAEKTERIQEMHIMVGHILCELVQQNI